MDSYPADYIEHNLPLVVLSGVSESPRSSDDSHSEVYSGVGPTVSFDKPPLQGELIEQILQKFLSADGSQLAWNSSSERSKDSVTGFKIKSIGRVHGCFCWSNQCTQLKEP